MGRVLAGRRLTRPRCREQHLIAGTGVGPVNSGKRQDPEPEGPANAAVPPIWPTRDTLKHFVFKGLCLRGGPLQYNTGPTRKRTEPFYSCGGMSTWHGGSPRLCTSKARPGSQNWSNSDSPATTSASARGTAGLNPTTREWISREPRSTHATLWRRAERPCNCRASQPSSCETSRG